MIFELLSLDFVRFALLASFLVSIIGGVVGSISVASRNVFLAGGVAHSAFGGVGLALFLGFAPMLGAIGFALLSALIVGFATLVYKERIDSYIGALWSFGMAFGVILIDLSSSFNADISSYLFGSIIAVSKLDLLISAIYDVVILLFVYVFYEKILAFLYDKDFSYIQGVRTNFLSVAIFVFIALGVVMSMSVAGLILVIAVFSIPSYIASLFTNSLKNMMIVGFFISLSSMWIGFFLAYFLDISPGACIVVLLCAIMACALVFQKIRSLYVKSNV